MLKYIAKRHDKDTSEKSRETFTQTRCLIRMVIKVTIEDLSKRNALYCLETKCEKSSSVTQLANNILTSRPKQLHCLQTGKLLEEYVLYK